MKNTYFKVYGGSFNFGKMFHYNNFQNDRNFRRCGLKIDQSIFKDTNKSKIINKFNFFN